MQCGLNTLGITLYRSKPYAGQNPAKSIVQVKTQLKPYAMLPKMLQTTLHKENVPLNVNSLSSLGPMQCCSRGSKEHFTGKNSGNSGNVIWMYISGPWRQKIYKVISSLTFYTATSQTFSRTLCKKVKLSATHAVLPKPMQSWPKCWYQDCISN